ncbi:MAG TPA: hypothetical protein VHH72_04810 [Solirubrobacterales bacterium]|jgi:hypothetical protein|nr:hypothetical protein [Solirubrobacterales bacterium]
MLFDLQSGKRRRVVQVVFGALAVIFAVSFVFFGVGSEAGFNPFSDGGGGGGDAAEAFEDDISAQEDRLATNPSDTAALAELVTLYYQSGTNQLDVDPSTGTASLTPEAEEELQKGADAWDRYLEASKQDADSSTALLAVQTFTTLGQLQLRRASGEAGEGALADADDALANFKDAGEAQLVVAAKGDPIELAQAAEYFYFGGDVAAGDQAAQEALAQTTGKEREQLQQRIDLTKQQTAQLNKQIEDYRKQLAKASGGGATGGDTPLGDLGGGGLGGGSLSTP